MIQRFERLIEKMFFAAALWSMLLVVMMFVFMVILGLPLFREGRFFQFLITPWRPEAGLFGVYPMMIGTAAISFLGLCFAFPLSLGVASFVSTIGPGAAGRFVKRVVLMMIAVPTVVYAFVAIFLLVPIVQRVFDTASGMGILTASIVVALLISPTMIFIFENSFNNVPQSYMNAVEALGGSGVQKLIYVILPYSWKGIASGLILGLGRAMGDTLIALMLAGNAVAIPDSIFESARTLTAHIALVTAADFDSVEFRTIFACGILLYLGTSVIILAVRFLANKGKRA